MTRYFKAPVRLMGVTALAAALTATPALSFEPVMFGSSDPDEDSCGGVVETIADNTRVHDAPHDGATILAYLPRQILLADCDAAGGGQWVGVVLLNGDECLTGTPIAPRQPYYGTCQSGWIRASDLRLIAG